MQPICSPKKIIESLQPVARGLGMTIIEFLIAVEAGRPFVVYGSNGCASRLLAADEVPAALALGRRKGANDARAIDFSPVPAMLRRAAAAATN